MLLFALAPLVAFATPWKSATLVRDKLEVIEKLEKEGAAPSAEDLRGLSSAYRALEESVSYTNLSGPVQDILRRHGLSDPAIVADLFAVGASLQNRAVPLKGQSKNEAAERVLALVEQGKSAFERDPRALKALVERFLIDPKTSARVKELVSGLNLPGYAPLSRAVLDIVFKTDSEQVFRNAASILQRLDERDPGVHLELADRLSELDPENPKELPRIVKGLEILSKSGRKSIENAPRLRFLVGGALQELLEILEDGEEPSEFMAEAALPAVNAAAAPASWRERWLNKTLEPPKLWAQPTLEQIRNRVIAYLGKKPQSRELAQKLLRATEEGADEWLLEEATDSISHYIDLVFIRPWEESQEATGSPEAKKPKRPKRIRPDRTIPPINGEKVSFVHRDGAKVERRSKAARNKRAQEILNQSVVESYEYSWMPLSGWGWARFTRFEGGATELVFGDQVFTTDPEISKQLYWRVVDAGTLKVVPVAAMRFSPNANPIEGNFSVHLETVAGSVASELAPIAIPVKPQRASDLRVRRFLAPLRSLVRRDPCAKALE